MLPRTAEIIFRKEVEEHRNSDKTSLGEAMPRNNCSGERGRGAAE